MVRKNESNNITTQLVGTCREKIVDVTQIKYHLWNQFKRVALIVLQFFFLILYS